MADRMQVTEQATSDITTWLLNKSETISVRNLEQDPAYQVRDIDLIWTTQTGEFLVEIKGDRWYKTGNNYDKAGFSKAIPSITASLKFQKSCLQGKWNFFTTILARPH